ncbi:MAG: sigma 54-interacting transcriptional regulator [Deltaproteobacteria bacterium]|nr:sigma 54-interacting transcriptional regulator [Deltaproteobacteria bacterium]
MSENRPEGQRDKILDSIADGVFTVDRDDNITFFNRAAEKIIGISQDQAVGQKCFDVFRANICQTACALRKTIESGRDLINLDINILNSQGRTIPVSVSTSVLKDENNDIVGGVETFRDLSTIETLRKEIRNQYNFGDIITKNHEVRSILDILPDIATSGSTVLIEGPSGSGKELFARAIHNLSGRKGEYVALNCGALPDTLLESELFGYEKGAFTEAKKDKPGRFKLAEGGTILLDEIGDISTALQLKLLRVLQEKEYEPLGAVTTVKADVRIIAATNKILSGLVEGGTFRQDLYYRLNVVKLSLPPLSRRREDIPYLLEHFIDRFNAVKGKNIVGVSDEALDILMGYDFPGNVRELENFIEYAFILCHGRVIETEHLPRELLENSPAKETKGVKPAVGPLESAEIGSIIEALREYGGNRRKTAAHLGINKTTLWRKMKKYELSYPL